MATLAELGKLIVEHWELLATLIALLGASGLLGIIITWQQKQREQQRKRKIAAGDFPFLVVKPYSSDVVKQLMEGIGSRANDPLADFNIPYQVRQQGKSVRQDLTRSFEQKPWVIILGRSGLGKTREASHLAQGLSEEGWTVLKLMEQGWLDVPRQFPEVISPQDKLLFVIDDLNRWIRSGNPREIHKNAEDLAQPLRVSVQERLLRVLEFFEQECRSEVRVIATARNEPGEEEKLQFEKYPKFWERFQRYELAQPEDAAIVKLLSDRTQEANISANPDDFPVLAYRSDGTFRNMVENLRTVQCRQQSLTLDTLAESLESIWRRRYKAAVKRNPAAKYIYDAVELLQLLNVPLSAELVRKTAALVVKGNGLKRLWRQWQIRQTLPDLIQTEQILQPRDGQIEGKERTIDAAFYIPKVLPILFGRVQESSDLVLIGYALFNLRLYEEALASYDKILHHNPGDHEACNNRGGTLYSLGRHEEALINFDQALQHKPDMHGAWSNRGTALHSLGQHEEAIKSFDQALQHKPNMHEAWYGKGTVQYNLGQPEEALINFDQALQHKPDYHEAWYVKGTVQYSLGQPKEALASYDQALHYKEDYHEAWNNRGAALHSLGQPKEALASYDQALHYKEDYHEAWNNRGAALYSLGQSEEAFASYDQALAIKPDYASAIYNKACIHGLQGQIEEAISCLKQAIQLNLEYREMAKTNASFAAIQGDALFQAMMEASAEENPP